MKKGLIALLCSSLALAGCGKWQDKKDEFYRSDAHFDARVVKEFGNVIPDETGSSPAEREGFDLYDQTYGIVVKKIDGKEYSLQVFRTYGGVPLTALAESIKPGDNLSIKWRRDYITTKLSDNGTGKTFPCLISKK